MRVTRLLLLGGVVFGLLWAPNAGAAVCGTAPGDGEEPLEAALELREKNSDFSIDFERGKGEKRILLVFDVSNCTIDPDEVVMAWPSSSDLPTSTFGDALVKSDRKLVEVKVPVFADEFGPGKYVASVTVGGRNVTPTVQGVSIQRSEGWILPTGIAFVCALVGYGLALGARKFSSGACPKGGWLFAGVIAVAAAVGAVWQTGYVETEVWQPDVKPIAALLFGSLSAAFGAATGAFVPNARKDASGE